MSYSQIYFLRELDSIKYEDIVSFFNIEREETNTLEFKSYNSKGSTIDRQIDEIAKGVCSFLNSEGGILIWGAPSGNKKPNKKEKIFSGNLAPIDETIEQDWLTNKLTSLITPLPTSIRNRILEKDGKQVVVIEIGKSNYSPHQTSNTYFIRLDGQKKPAPHYLIEAMFRQIKYPNLEGYLVFKSYDYYATSLFLTFDILIFNFSELQNETNVTYFLICSNGKFEGHNNQYANVNPAFWYSTDGHEFYSEKEISILHYGAPRIETMTLVFDIEELKNTQNTIIRLSFGGKNSPLKTSFYKLNLTTSMNINNIVVEREENKLPSETKNNTAQTKEQILSQALNRKP